MLTGRIQLYVEITDITHDSCEVLVVGTDLAGQQCVIDAQQCSWPIFARDWRPMMDTSRRWLTEACPG